MTTTRLESTDEKAATAHVHVQSMLAHLASEEARSAAALRAMREPVLETRAGIEDILCVRKSIKLADGIIRVGLADPLSEKSDSAHYESSNNSAIFIVLGK